MFPTFELFGFRLYSYPLLMGVAWGAAINLALYYCGKLSINIPKLKQLMIIQFLLGWIGAKVLFLITTDNSAPLGSNVSFWLGGGFVFYGGLITASIATIIFFKVHKVSLVKANIFIPALTFGHAIGRVGCFLAGCCYGTHCDLPWAIQMHGASRHPVQLYEAGMLILMNILFHTRLKVGQVHQLWAWYFLLYSITRFVLEFFRGDQVRGVFAFGLSTSQLISILIAIIIVLYMVLRRPRKS